jgi:hypothetical protein
MRYCLEYIDPVELEARWPKFDTAEQLGERYRELDAAARKLAPEERIVWEKSAQPGRLVRGRNVALSKRERGIVYR